MDRTPARSSPVDAGTAAGETVSAFSGIRSPIVWCSDQPLASAQVGKTSMQYLVIP